MSKKIAFLFLIYDIINLEELWNLFFYNIDKNKYNIYIHYKYNKPLKYFNNYKLKNCINTKYADITLVKAQNILLQHALNDENNEHFIFLSNSCIPFKNFDHIYNNLDTNKSYFNIMPKEQCFNRCNRLLKYIDKEYIQKASQWCILNKKHSSLMIRDTKYLKFYKNIYAPDEICYITNIFRNNLQEEIVFTLNSAEEATTFTNWQGGSYKFPSQKSLKLYDFITDEEIIHLINSKCFFGRKFDIKCIDCFKNDKYLSIYGS
jgi:hypothetical protein